jgi:hypothetical protein
MRNLVFEPQELKYRIVATEPGGRVINILASYLRGLGFELTTDIVRDGTEGFRGASRPRTWRD